MDDQTAAIAFLSDPATHAADRPVQTIQTHISHIFLTGPLAFKLKRALRLPYADFSTPDLRLAACEKELALNRRTAPDLYQRIRRITTRAGGGLEFDGPGRLVDAVVQMRRFEQRDLFDRMAQDGRLDAALMADTARRIAAFHQGAPVIETDRGAEAMAAVLDINLAGFAAGKVFAPAQVQVLDGLCRQALARHAALLDRRAAQGRLRRCHGDLHLRNICLLDGRPRLFDCIEFNDELASCDMLYDLAFLLMDLCHRGLGDLGNLVMNRYLDITGDDEGFVLLPFFMAVRASVRAHVIATGAETGTGAEAEARAYHDLALSLLRPPSLPQARPQLVAIGGRSGTGKTTIADMLAPRLGPAPGARVIESDRIRKALHGVPADSPLPEAAYRAQVSAHVYDQMIRRAELILSGGGMVVADAVFERASNRQDIADCAARAGAPFLGIWLQAPAEVLHSRVAARRGGPSDATTDILARQLRRDPGDITWQCLDAGRAPEQGCAHILALLNGAP